MTVLILTKILCTILWMMNLRLRKSLNKQKNKHKLTKVQVLKLITCILNS